MIGVSSFNATLRYGLSPGRRATKPDSRVRNCRPLISVRELVDTLLFFKTRNAKEVALRRDAQREHSVY